MEALHDYGVTHGGVVFPADFRHLTLDVDAPGLSSAGRLNGKARCYIVDFAEARQHQCGRRLPVLPLDALLNSNEFGCAELANVTYLLKFMKTSHRCMLFGLIRPTRTHVIQCPPIARRTRLFSGTPNTPNVFPTSLPPMC